MELFPFSFSDMEPPESSMSLFLFCFCWPPEIPGQAPLILMDFLEIRDKPPYFPGNPWGNPHFPDTDMEPDMEPPLLYSDMEPPESSMSLFFFFSCWLTWSLTWSPPFV